MFILFTLPGGPAFTGGLFPPPACLSTVVANLSTAIAKMLEESSLASLSISLDFSRYLRKLISLLLKLSVSLDNLVLPPCTLAM